MSDIVKGLGDLIGSILEIFKGIVTSIINIFQSVLGLFTDLIKNVFGAAEGIIGFILGKFFILAPDTAVQRCSMLIQLFVGNIFLIGTLVAVGFAYLFYQQRQGRAVVVGGKKIN